jgi:predicted ATP-dependent protease
MIPASNVKNLMLKEKVVQAVRDGTFHIWSVETIDEGIEILTGVRAGSRKADGSFEDGTVSALVDQRLRNLAESMCKFAGATGSGGKAEE